MSSDNTTVVGGDTGTGTGAPETGSKKPKQDVRKVLAALPFDERMATLGGREKAKATTSFKKAGHTMTLPARVGSLSVERVEALAKDHGIKHKEPDAELGGAEVKSTYSKEGAEAGLHAAMFLTV